MWNSLGTELCNNPEDEKIRPWFFPWSLMCRYFLPGSAIIPVQVEGNDKLHVVAGELDENFTAAIVNTGDEAFEFSLKSDHWKKIKNVKKYIYEEGNYLTDDYGLPLPAETGIEMNLAKGEVIKIESNSVILLSNIQYEE